MTDDRYYVLYCTNNKKYIEKYPFVVIKLSNKPNIIFSSKLATDMAYSYFKNIIDDLQSPIPINMVIKEIKLVDHNIIPSSLDNLDKFTVEVHTRYGDDLFANFPEDISQIINKNLQFSYIIFNDASNIDFNNKAQLVNMNMCALATNDRNVAITYKLVLNNPLVINPKTLEIM